ncbi:ADP-ribosylglycohydrolase family protein [Nocardioides cavernae]|uniref:ADP-ribosylglycohydrolase family protein n=1 Tax=Nocardioides cavernae TaxID=1921566 RepID=A0ABR8N553_9ACTN|nr:ADP-ribosylglycohydrolase family protein [Nocardioides cavernae]MBD3923288.1 ADP-ribosylglycohydrolase family protein [Nocardioides cavernae]MBM7511790.1 ADP-ribosylglycohydrolase [Nocardioides cavernae]
MRLDNAQLDRAVGALLGSAVGDALGAGYEFGSAPYGGWPAMIGGGLGGFAPGEWTDDTAQAVAIARVAATGADLRSEEALDAIAAGFAEWYAGGPDDVGVQTGTVLRRAGRDATGRTMSDAARFVHAQLGGRSAGNGSLMRTVTVALAHLDDPVALVAAANAVSALTHHDPIAGEGAALWCLAIRHAVLDGRFPDASDVLPMLGDTVHDWAAVLAEADAKEPGHFHQNGWVVGALQAAWSAIRHTPEPQDMPCRHLQEGLATAIGIGNDTDTVAAIAGALLGARWGASAVPQEWQAPLHGWGVDQGAVSLVALATTTVQGGRTRGRDDWPLCERMDYRGYGGESTYVTHPLVDGVWIGGALPLDDLPEDIDAVVSLCRVGTRQVPDHVASHAVRLLDTVAEDNPNVAFVIDDAARTVLRLRNEGKRVFLHCVAAHSRTPTVAARIAMLDGHSLEESVTAVVAALPAARPRAFLIDALRTLDRNDRAAAEGDSR